MFREAVSDDFAAVLGLYRQLHQSDPVPDDGSDLANFNEILTRPGLQLFVLEAGGSVVATTY